MKEDVSIMGMIAQINVPKRWNSDEERMNEKLYWGSLSEVQRDNDVIIRAWDDITGVELDPSLVMAARIEEMREVKKHGVYIKVPINTCMETTGKKPIAVRWVDINKGDEVNPDYRSRLVAKEIKIHKNDDLFAANLDL
jgi:hypothetical protein